MKKLFTILTVLYLTLANGQTTTVQNLKIVQTPATVTDTANVKPMIWVQSGANAGKVFITTWSTLASFVNTPNLSQVLTAGNTAEQDAILTNEHGFVVQNATGGQASFNFVDEANITSTSDTLRFNTRRVLTEEDIENFFSLTTKRENATIAFTGSNNNFDLTATPYNTSNEVFLNGILLKAADYTILGANVSINSSLLTSGVSYDVSVIYNTPLQATDGYAPTFRTFDTYADMIAAGVPSKPTISKVLEDENKNIGQPTYYISTADGRGWIAVNQD